MYIYTTQSRVPISLYVDTHTNIDKCKLFGQEAETRFLNKQIQSALENIKFFFIFFF